MDENLIKNQIEFVSKVEDGEKSDNCENSETPATTEHPNGIITTSSTSTNTSTTITMENNQNTNALTVYDDLAIYEAEDDESYITDSNSGDTDLSELSTRSNTPMNLWIQAQVESGANPREILSQIFSKGAQSPIFAAGVSDITLWRILGSMLAEPPRRAKLRHVNTIGHVLDLLKSSKNIIVLTGAGVSVSCGIPDFRSSDGIYSRLAKDFPNLRDPQSMFDISYFCRDPRPFYKFAREIYPGQFTPSPCHRFIKLLEEKNKLLRNYTQNIDTLERVAGIENVIECHGSFSTATCTKCKYTTTAEEIREDIFAQRIPFCPICQPYGLDGSIDNDDPDKFQKIVEDGIMKPDIVFFGEGLPEEFHTVMASDKDKCDLLIVIGSSLKVRPVALIPNSIPSKVPQILINREQLKHLQFDVELLGDSDIIINQICHMLSDDWNKICWKPEILTESLQLKPRTITEESDTQSIASTEITPTSNGFSDSGFESSTSSFQPPMTRQQPNDCNKRNFGEFTKTEEHDDFAAISGRKKLKQLDDFPNSSPDNQDDEYDGGETDQEDRESCSSPYNNSRLNPKHATVNNLRHLSVDSSKDSGICDSSSNSVPLSSATLASRDCDSEEAQATNRAEPTSSLAPTTTKTKATTASQTTITKTQINRHSWMHSLSKKTISAAERLHENTYYNHQASSSYVFPGAQVSWSSDSEDDDDDDNDDDDDTDDDDDNEEDVEEQIHSQIEESNDTPPVKPSPLHREQKTHIEENDDAPPIKKRRADDDTKVEEQLQPSTLHRPKEAHIQENNDAPPIKKRCADDDNSQIQQIEDALG